MKDQERNGKTMIVDEMELVSRLGDVEELPGEAFERARTVLHTAIDLEAAAETTPRPVLPRRPRRTVRRTIGIGIGFAAAAATVALVVATTTQLQTSPHRPAISVSAALGTNAPLMRLADNITVNNPVPVGDATLVLRTTTHPNQTPSNAADLYADSGSSYYAPSEGGLPAEIAAKNDRGTGASAREVAAAISAVTGNLATARKQMADAGFAPGLPVPPASTTADSSTAKPTPEPLGTPGGTMNVDNYVWENSMSALIAGAGNPQVRAGVLRILSTLSEVTVTNTTTSGQPTLTLTATGRALPANYQEVLTIDAHTGIPLAFAGGAPKHSPYVTIAYRVSRVNLSDIAAGKI